MLFTVFFAMMLTTGVFAQEPPPPPDLPSGEGGSNLPVGGGAPIGEGIALLIALAAGYGYRIYKRERN